MVGLTKRKPPISPQYHRAPVKYISYLWVDMYVPWASLVAQWYGICLSMQEMQVQSPGREDPLEEGMATHFSILAWRNP